MLPLMLVSGANAFLYEVLWTRMLAHVMGGSIYAFATMLAAFLTGIALGGGLAGKVAENRERAAVAFAFTQVAIGVLSMGVYAWMGPLIPDVRTTAALALFAVAVMLPATIFIGATLPLSVRVLARDESEATVGTARIYAWNTVGAIIGAILAGFVLIPGLGFEGSIRIAVGVNFALALWAAGCVARPRPIPGRHRVRRYRRGACALQSGPATGGGGKLRIQLGLSSPATGTVLRRRALLHSDAARLGHQLLPAHQRPARSRRLGQGQAAHSRYAEMADRTARSPRAPTPGTCSSSASAAVLRWRACRRRWKTST